MVHKGRTDTPDSDTERLTAVTCTDYFVRHSVPTTVVLATVADRVYVSLGTAGTYPGYGPVYRNVPW